MSLDYDYTAVVTDDQVLIESAIWATLATGIPSLTVDNASEFFARVNFVERIQGAYRRDGEGKPVFFTSDEVLSLAGLKTNASPLTQVQFRKLVWSNHVRFNIPRGI